MNKIRIYIEVKFQICDIYRCYALNDFFYRCHAKFKSKSIRTKRKKNVANKVSKNTNK